MCWLDVEKRIGLDPEPVDVLAGAMAIMYDTARLPADPPLNRFARGLSRLVRRLRGEAELAAQADLTGAQLLGMPLFHFRVGLEPQAPAAAQADVAEMLGAVEDALVRIRTARGRPIVWIADGLDKVDLGTAKRLFAESALLVQPSCHAVFTAPFELFHSPELQQALGYFTAGATLRMPFLSPGEIGPRLEALLRRRLEAAGAALDLVSAEAVEHCVRKSGGVPRSFVELVGEMRAQRRDEPSLTPLLARRAEERLAELFQLGLDGPRMAYVCRVWREKPPRLPDGFPEEERFRLLRNLYLLYQRQPGHASPAIYAVHPLLEPYLERECPKLTASSSA